MAALQRSSNENRSKIRTGILLLALAASFTGASFLGGSKVYFLGWPTMAGALLLYRGLRQRRLRALDRATRANLIRRA